MKTADKIRNLQNATRTGTIEANYEISDEINPAYLFNLTYTDLLTRIASGEINCQQLAKQQLADRGLDLNGTWIGFKAAKAAL